MYRLRCPIGSFASPGPSPKQVGSSKNFGGRRGAARGPLDTRAALEGWVQVGK